MVISREHVKKIFKDYTDRYDATDGKIKLKIDHTYRVAEICERIAKSLALSAEDVDLAWLLGMLHDVGRFEQLRQYGTFSDAQSIDHAHFGVELLYGSVDASGFLSGNRTVLSDDSAEKSKEKEERKISENDRENQHGKADTEQKEHRIFLEEFVHISSEEEAFQVIKTAIWNHSAFRIEEGLEERMEMFCHILRDADKVDIFKVCHDTPVEVIYNVTTEEVRHAGVTEEVMKQFFEKHAVLRSVKKTPVDHLVGHAALAFELVYPESLKVAKEQGYLKKILEYPSENEKTVEQLRKLREFLENYLEQ